MAIDRDGLDRVLHAFDEGDWDEIHLSADGIELHLSIYPDAGPAADRGSYQAARHTAGRAWPVPVTDQESGTAGAGTPTGAAVHAESPGETGEPAETDSPGETGEPAETDSPGADVAPLVDVVAPTPGIFWRSPAPGAPPYAAVGDRVVAGDTLCILEVMKLMSQVTAQQAGTVVEVLGQNGELVELGQVLFRIGADGLG